VRLIAIGRLRAGPEAELFARYAARLRPRLDLRELPDATGSPAEIRKREGAALLAALSGQDTAIALDLGGVAPTSEGFAALLQTLASSGRNPAFLIGGAEGLSPDVTAQAHTVLSLGALTWPHMLVRVMLAEQIFRAQCIAGNHPYHRGFRP
jgi:23S rRNA (pseudouridine1915-N3)-methyltransferase